MKIAFISYEYPPDTADGGIATSIQQAARMLAAAGDYVEVFAGSPEREGTFHDGAIRVHRIRKRRRTKFPQAAGLRFKERHAEVQFDVLEGPEYQADARPAVQLVPGIPLVVKLHTPSFIIEDLAPRKRGFGKRLRMALRHGLRPARSLEAIERSVALDADEITSPSQALADIVIAKWQLDASRVQVIPNLYVPSAPLLDIPAETRTGIVAFLGRLEMRKGILDLAQAIPLILQRHPDTRFRLIGRPGPSPNPRRNMREYIADQLKTYQKSFEFIGPVRLEQIPTMLAQTDICVFPSIWENFPNVCLEAMAAARGIVGSSSGGMGEMLVDGASGRLVPPRSPEHIAAAVIQLLEQPARRMELGRAARARLLDLFGSARIGPLQRASYARAIARRKALGPR